jgi:biotin/methionine sulfoxide reductase
VDPAEDKPIGVHGNQSVLRRDAGTLAQGCTGQLAVVQVGTFNGNLPPTPRFRSAREKERRMRVGSGPRPDR